MPSRSQPVKDTLLELIIFDEYHDTCFDLKHVNFNYILLKL